MRIILVHGTFDNDLSEEGERWWQHGGAMRRDLDAAGHRTEAFQWSGENSDRARMAGAQALARQLSDLAAEDVRVLAHSHGGNVAREALALLDEEQRARIEVVTIGTPFIDRTPPLVRHVWRAETILLALLAVAAIFGPQLVGSNLQVASGLSDNEMMRVFLGVITVWAIIFGIRTFRARPAAYAPAAARIRALSHRQDEAVSMLQMADRQKIAAATPASARGTLRLAMTPLVFLGMIGAVGWLVATFVLNWETSNDEIPFLIAGVPILAAMSYFGGIIAISLLSWPLSYVAPPVLNGLVQSTIRSSGLGLDSGASCKRVGPSPLAGDRIAPLDEALEGIIRDHANRALQGRIGILREVLTTAAEKGIDPMKALDDTFTWDELIHTAYFRVPEARALIISVLDA